MTVTKAATHPAAIVAALDETNGGAGSEPEGPSGKDLISFGRSTYVGLLWSGEGSAGLAESVVVPPTGVAVIATDPPLMYPVFVVPLKEVFVVSMVKVLVVSILCGGLCVLGRRTNVVGKGLRV